LYLWHWPLFSFAAVLRSETPTVAVRAVIVGASFVLAWLTYRFIERPVRFGPPRRATVPVLCSVLAAVLITGLVTSLMDGLPGRSLNLSDGARFLQYYDRMRVHGLAKAYWDACDFMDWDSRRTRESLDPECTRRGARGTVFLWGDSYAQALSNGLRRLLPPGISLAQIATSGCPPQDGSVDTSERCQRSDRGALAAISELRPDVVVLAQSGQHDSVDWTSLARQIRSRGARRVLLMGPTPQWRPSLPQVIARQYWGRDYERVKLGLDQGQFAADAALKLRYGHSPELDFVSMLDRLCNDDGCIATVPGGKDLVVVDSGHLTPRGSIFVVERVLGAGWPGRLAP
jgi:hypothetical protein